jgi:4,5-epoxidase
MRLETEVLVVGAGPTGLTLATLLRKSGIDCLVIDKAEGPSTTSKAIGLQYRVSELLACMGLIDAFAARAVKQTTVNMLVDGSLVSKLVLGEFPAAVEGAFAPRVLIIPQSETERLLGSALGAAGGRVQWSSEFVSLSQGEGYVEALLSSSDTVRAQYLVSCEGAHSVARKQLNIAFDGQTYPHDFIMADVTVNETALKTGQAYSFLHPRGVLSAITMPGERRWRLFIEAGDTRVEDVTLQVVRDLYAERTGDRHSAISDPTWLTRFKIHSRIVERFRVGRVFLAGDAAHVHSPSGGQGITTGMQDATNLAWKLVHVLRHGAVDSLLDTYEEERRPAAVAVLLATDRNTKLLFARTRLRRWFRDRIFLPLLGTPFVQKRLLGRLSQLNEGYRAASLARAAPRMSGRGLRAGDRVPDVTLAGGGTLFSLLGQGKMVALLGGAQAELSLRLSERGIVVGSLSDEATPVLGSPEDVWLVRPDGYLAGRCPLAKPEPLFALLPRFIGSTRASQTALSAAPTTRRTEARPGTG